MATESFSYVPPGSTDGVDFARPFMFSRLDTEDLPLPPPATQATRVTA